MFIVLYSSHSQVIFFLKRIIILDTWPILSIFILNYILDVLIFFIYNNNIIHNHFYLYYSIFITKKAIIQFLFN